MENIKNEEFDKLDEAVFFSKFFRENVSVHLVNAVKSIIYIIFIDENADTPTKRIQHYYAHKALKDIKKLFYESRHYEENK